MSLREAAHNALALGLVIFPLKAEGTRPIVKFGTDTENQVATNIDEAERWWRSHSSRKNIGVRCGWSDALGAYLVVVDIDKQHDGDQSILKLCQEHGPLPDTYAIQTPSGGWHFYFISEHDIRNSASKLGPGIDIRGHNGFAVGEGSVRAANGKKPAGEYTYCGNTREIAWLPLWIEERLLEDSETSSSNADLPDNDTPLEDVPAGVRNDRLFREAAGLRGKGAGRKAIHAYLTERNKHFKEPLPESEIDTIAMSASRYSVNQESIYEKLSQDIARQLAKDTKKKKQKHPDAEPEKEIKPFQGIWSPDLYEKDIAPLQYCIDPLLAEGLYLLNGRPKGGKSWLAMELAAAVAEGYRLWSEYTTNQGEVLYLALEDGERRLKERLAHYGNPRNIFLVTDGVERIGAGLEEQIDMWMLQRPSTKMIVVDILQRVIGEKTNQGESIYKFDYNMVKALQEQAQRLRVCMLIVHHTRKMVTDHVVDSVSGSQGLAGAADGVWFLQSPANGKTGKLTLLSRDTDNGIYDLARADKPSGRWELIGEAGEEEDNRGRLDAVILATLNVDGPSTVAELAKATHSSRQYVQDVLTKLLDDEEVTRERQGSANSPYVYQILQPDIPKPG